jgi:23S rRNA-/tRNA-specific pseudouridylate synthase
MPILFQAPHALVLNKAPSCHSEEALLHCVELQGLDPKEWLPAHRLDFLTSGCLLYCQKDHLEAYTKLFKTRCAESKNTQKIYLAGAEEASASQELEIQGHILSRYRSSKSVRFVYPRDSTLRKKWHSKREVSHKVRGLPEWPCELGFTGHPHQVLLETGARHQIRAFFAAAGNPIKGDPIYNPNSQPEEKMELHAWQLLFNDPISGKRVHVQADTRAAQAGTT